MRDDGQKTNEKRIKATVWFDPEIYKAMQHAVIDEEFKSLGEMLETVWRARITLVRRG